MKNNATNHHQSWSRNQSQQDRSCSPVPNHLQFDPIESWTAPYSDQVPPWLSLPLNKFLFSPLISAFPSLSLVQVRSFFYWQYLQFMIFRFSSPITLISWEIFYRLISYSVFLFSLSIIALGGSSPATWPFETHQLPYGARMFSVVFQLSSPNFPRWIGRFFSPGSHFL